MKEQFLRMENENIVMRELKKKVGREIEKIAQKRGALMNSQQENPNGRQNYLDLIYEEVQNLRERGNQEKNLDQEQQKKVQEIINLVREERERRMTLTQKVGNTENSLVFDQESLVSENIYGNTRPNQD